MSSLPLRNLQCESGSFEFVTSAHGQRELVPSPLPALSLSKEGEKVRMRVNRDDG